MIKILDGITITKKVAILIILITIETIVFITNYFNDEEEFKTFYVVSMPVLFSSTIILSLNLLKSIKELIVNLNIKTSELTKLNKELQDRINTEVEKNREKDKIMYQHSRLAAMGEMVGNIAHQWRQPLNAMTVLIQSFAIKNMSGKLTDDFIEKQVEEGLRLSKMMSDTIDDFRNFFTPNKSREYFDIKECIEDTINIAQEKDINITIKCDENIRIYGYQNEFSQVILNLLSNSIDCFSNIKTKYDKNILIDVKKDDEANSVSISFIDNGGGIDESIIDRIFEPYFTTKHKSTGTGIGLYMSKQIIEKQMRGSLTAKNITMNFDHNSYRCAKFDISLPLMETNTQKADKNLCIA